MKKKFGICYLIIIAFFTGFTAHGQTPFLSRHLQISARSEELTKDLSVDHFILGSKDQQSADSLYDACRAFYKLKRSADVTVTDALDYVARLGWELVTVYMVPGVGLNFNTFYYVLRRKE